MLRSVEELHLAGKSLSSAEKILGTDDERLVWAYSSDAVRHAVMAVAYAYLEELECENPREAILRAMEAMPPRLWAEALRLLEILRSVSSRLTGPSIDLAREAVEIASGIVLSRIPAGSSCKLRA